MITLLQPKPGGWLLMVGPPSKYSTAISAIVHLTEKGPLRVLDCADYFHDQARVPEKAYRDRVSRKEITIARASTCHQVLEALRGMKSTPTEYVVLDLLRPFYTWQAETEDRKGILRACIKQLDRLAKKASGIVTVSPPVIPTSTALELLGLLNASSNRRLSTEAHSNTYSLPGSAGKDQSFWDLPIF